MKTPAMSLNVQQTELLTEQPKKSNEWSFGTKVALGLVCVVLVICTTAVTTVMVAGAMAPRYVDPMMDNFMTQAREEIGAAGVNLNPMYNVKALLGTDFGSLARTLQGVIDKISNKYGDGDPNQGSRTVDLIPQGLSNVYSVMNMISPFLKQAGKMATINDPSGQTDKKLLGILDLGYMAGLQDTEFHDVATMCIGMIDEYKKSWSWSDFDERYIYHSCYDSGGDQDGVGAVPKCNSSTRMLFGSQNPDDPYNADNKNKQVNDVNKLVDKAREVCVQVQEIFAP